MEAAEDKIIYIFPGYSTPMSAGTGQPAGEEYPENYRLVKEPPRGASYIAPVSGDSMEPTYQDGDLLGDGVLLSHNPEYEPRLMTDDIRCQGLVLGVCDESYFE